jgi:hypothetical protein
MIGFRRERGRNHPGIFDSAGEAARLNPPKGIGNTAVMAEDGYVSFVLKLTSVAVQTGLKSQRCGSLPVAARWTPHLREPDRCYPRCTPQNSGNIDLTMSLMSELNAVG